MGMSEKAKKTWPASDVFSSRVENVSPDRAKEYLDHLGHNRTLDPNRVRLYSADILADRWLLSHQGIAFTRDGVLIDGQHRLRAIIEANRSIMLVVTVGLPPEAINAIDIGKIRTITDLERMAGRSTQAAHVAIARAMMFGLRHVPKPTVAAQREFIGRYWEGIEFAVASCSRRSGITTAPVLAPIARAYFSQDQEKLKRFAQVVSSGMGDEVLDNAALLLRAWLVDVRAGNRAAASGAAAVGTGTLGRYTILYAKTERALKGHLTGELLGRLYASSEELFPLPGEEE